MTRLQVGLSLCVMLALAVTGCRENEPIRAYPAPKVRVEPPRLLAAIVPAGEKVWFFKLSGAAPAVAAEQARFLQFVESLRFSDRKEAPVAWTLPPGWRESEGRSQLRWATLRAGSEALEFSVTPLGRESGAILPNINRWRGQIGLGKIDDESDLKPPSRRVSVDGKDVTLVDMTGVVADPKPVSPKTRGPEAAINPDKPLTYAMPAGWKELPVKGMRVAAFEVRDGGMAAEVTIIPIAGAGGGLLPNVNRWRKEVGLDDTTGDQLAKESQTIDLGGASAVIVDLAGKSESTLGAIITHDERTWFIKLRGPSTLIDKEREHFQAFVRSIRFRSGGPS